MNTRTLRAPTIFLAGVLATLIMGLGIGLVSRPSKPVTNRFCYTEKRPLSAPILRFHFRFLYILATYENLTQQTQDKIQATLKAMPQQMSPRPELTNVNGKFEVVDLDQYSCKDQHAIRSEIYEAALDNRQDAAKILAFGIAAAAFAESARK